MRAVVLLGDIREEVEVEFYGEIPSMNITQLSTRLADLPEIHVVLDDMNEFWLGRVPSLPKLVSS